MNNEEKIKKPKDFWIIFSIIISIASLLVSFFTYKTNLNLKKADLVFSELETTIIHDECINKEKFKCDYIVPIIFNNGEAAAKNIHFTIYKTSIDGSIAFNGKIVEKTFNTYSLNEVPPKTYQRFGTINQIQTSENNTNLISSPIALIFYISYTDSLTKKFQNKLFFYQYSIGGDSMLSIIKEDFNKIYSKLLSDPEINKNPTLVSELNRFHELENIQQIQCKKIKLFNKHLENILKQLLIFLPYQEIKHFKLGCNF